MADKIARPVLAPSLRVALILLIALLLVALAATIVVVGSQLLNPKPQVYDIPRGGAAVLVYGVVAGSSADQQAGDILTVKADGTGLRRLTSGPGEKWSATWSPDGTRIAYRLWDKLTDSVIVMDGGGGNRKTLVANTLTSRECVRGAMAWSRDGRHLVFATPAACSPANTDERLDGPYDLFIVPADGSSPAVRLLAPGLNGVSAAWSPDGTRIALFGSDADASTALYVVDVGPGGAATGGLKARAIGPGPAGRLADATVAPQWSPDGTTLAVATGPAIPAATDRVVVVKADGSGQRVLAENAYNPSWSPDGRRLAFYRTVDPSEYFAERPCTARIWIVDADGANERRLEQLLDGCGDPPLWSPDGTRLAGSVIASTPTEPARSFHLGIITIDGSSPLVVLQDAFGTWQPLDAPLPAAPSLAAP